MHPPPAVFYSWQSDLPARTNRTLIEDAIELAVKKLKINAERSLRLDSDTMDEPGSPNIPAVIFTKIPGSAVFVGVVSIVQAARPESKERRSPNPNVLIELGFAAHAVGWGRIITVMNTFYGEAGLLPFDLQQHKFPLTYRSAPDESERAPVRTALAEQFEARIRHEDDGAVRLRSSDSDHAARQRRQFALVHPARRRRPTMAVNVHVELPTLVIQDALQAGADSRRVDAGARPPVVDIAVVGHGVVARDAHQRKLRVRQERRGEEDPIN